MSDYKNIGDWCKEYSKKVGVKVYPQSAPIQLLVEDMLGQINKLREICDATFEILHNITTRIDRLEKFQGAKKEAKKK